MTLIIGALFLTHTVISYAEETAESKEIEKRLKVLADELELTDEQREKVKGIYEDTYKKIQEVPDVTGRKLKIRKLILERSAAIKATLTAEQAAELEELKKSKKSKIWQALAQPLAG
ncbi:MAG: hypothetical protein AAGA18_08725 [Verrucomicrobiota bacterium]